MTDETPDQAVEQSVEDKIAAKFGVTAETEETQEAQGEIPVEGQDESQEPDEVEVEYDGDRFKVPKKLEKAILQEADYTRKTQEIAEQRRILEQSVQAMNLATKEREFEQSVAEERHNIRTIDNYVNDLKAQNFNDMPSDDLIRSLLNIKRAEDRRAELTKSIESKQAEFEKAMRAAIDETKGKAAEVLTKLIPGFTPDSFKDVRAYAKSKGFTDMVLDSIELDAKSASMLWKAMRYDQLQSEKTSAVKKLDPKMIKPGSSKPMPQDVKNKLNFRKAMNAASTSQEKARLIEQRLAGQF